MSILADKLILTKIWTTGSDSFVAKPLYKPRMMVRIKDAIAVLRGKKIAVHFKEDFDFNSYL